MFLVRRCQGLREEREGKREGKRGKKEGEEKREREGKRGWFKFVRQVNRQTDMADVPNMILYGDSPCILS